MDEQLRSRKFDGWINDETRAVGLWLDSDEFSRWYWPPKALASTVSDDEQAASHLADQLREAMDEDVPDELRGVALSEVDWVGIAEKMRENASERWSSRSRSCDAPLMMKTSPAGETEEQPGGIRRSEGGESYDLSFANPRAEAIEIGNLVDVTEAAEEAGFRIPVALTCLVFDRYVVVPDGVEAQDERGRLSDVLSMCSRAFRRSRRKTTLFSLRVRNANRPGTPPLVKLKAIREPGDQGEPVITIMLPEQE